jgi:hypothetical protein
MRFVGKSHPDTRAIFTSVASFNVTVTVTARVGELYVEDGKSGRITFMYVRRTLEGKAEAMGHARRAMIEAQTAPSGC